MASAGPGLDTDDVAAKFRLSPRQIARALEAARVEARPPAPRSRARADLDAGARQASNGGLVELAARVTTAYGWDDLVLPDRELELLRRSRAYLRHRDRVLDEWGFDADGRPGAGLTALFAGESGTGKTMAAEVIARDLGLDLYARRPVDGRRKYIGETEKNLDRIFAAAEGAQRVLFFDEADALFGKRSEVQRRARPLRQHRGRLPAAAHGGATTGAVDPRHEPAPEHRRRVHAPARLRRRLPAARSRRTAARSGAGCCPSAAPVADDIDLDFLADHFELSGGNIRNCSLAAAFLAPPTAGGRSPCAHLVRGVAREYRKLGRLTVEADFEPAPPPKPAPEPPARPPAPPPQRMRIGSRIEEL